MRDGLGYFASLAHAERVGVDRSIASLGQSDFFEDLVGPFEGLGFFPAGDSQ
jgi:hypothetical protein